MANVKMVGSIGHLSVSPAKFGRKSFTFDGTTKDLVRAAYLNGARTGDVVQANYGGGFRNCNIIAAPHDDRAFGLWVA